MFRSLIVIISVLWVSLSPVTAQQDKQAEEDSLFSRYRQLNLLSYFTGPYLIIRTGDENLKRLKVMRRLNESIAIIYLDSINVLRSLKGSFRIGEASDDWKFSPQAEKILAAGNRSQQYVLTGNSVEELLAAIKSIAGVKVLYTDHPSHSIIIKAGSNTSIEKIAALPQVIFIDVKQIPHTEVSIIGYNRSFHGINALDYTIPGANGKNIVAGVKEQKMEAADLDLFKRVLPSAIAATSITNHATVISSIIGGSGNSFYDGRGMAYGCTFFPSTFDNLFADDAAVLTTNKVSVQNHSYGTIVQQFYGAEAVSYDAQTWLNKNLLHVFSAGNRGTAAAAEGRYAGIAGYANLTGNFKMAKNIITVGAIDNRENIPAESSAGPLYDGRLAPQLTALGPNGTSDAAAMVSGAIAVLQQVYADSNSQALPPASLVKALLYNTSDDIHTKGIDYKTGYGVLNAFAAVKALQQKNYDGSSLGQGQVWTRNIIVPANAAILKVTLAWTDTTAAANNLKAVINDLDLELTETTSGIIYKPWVLSTAAHADSLVKLPTRKRDSLNIAEQVSIELPVAGIYQIKVNGTAISTVSLPFNIAFNIDTLNTFHFTSPQHASDVNRAEEEELTIRWTTFVADTNQTGNLYISYNSGTNWQLLKAAHKIYTNKYRWSIKDTSSKALLRMETGLGNFFSKEFVISPVNRPVVDFFCADSFGLSWKRHVYASSYKVYCLIDSPYLKPLLTLADTFIVLNRSAYPSMVYAVEPVLSNALPAARSVAFDISFQGVKCFYRTFYYNLPEPGKVDLIVELSSANYADSIFFEEVSVTGQLLRTYSGEKIIQGDLIYNQLVNDLSQGTTYWRARIRLKSGQTVYTETVSVLTPGQQFILFYPNPASRHIPLNLVIRQGVPSDSRLQLFDISGRLVKDYASLPASIDLSLFSTGVFIYKLVSVENKILETGKLLIR